MKELLILDEPGSKGYAYTSSGKYVRPLDPGGKWRVATRREYIWFQFTRERFSYRYLLICLAIVWAFDTALHLITGA